MQEAERVEVVALRFDLKKMNTWTRGEADHIGLCY